MTIQDSVLLTDLYQLTMLQSYLDHGMEDLAVFEFFVRSLPPVRGFLIAAGLEHTLEFMEALHVEPWELDWLASTGRFSTRLLDYLAHLRFTGDVHAMPEGTVFFPNEPVVRVIAPLPQAQLIETRLINLMHVQTVIASKAARLVLTARGKGLIDFGFRRAHGAEAGLLAARAAYVAGFSGTATVLAGARFGIPLYGTMAHSFIQAHTSESLAFEHFADSHPDQVVLLIDTYDTEAGARQAVSLAPALARKGIRIKGVRLDSGDLADHARKVRVILDEAGLRDATIIASGNIDEAVLRQLVTSGAPIDAFAIGTHVTTSADRPYIDCVYKLMEYGGRPCRKRSEGKATWPGRKQVYRQHTATGAIARDVLALEAEHHDGTPLLKPMMQGGRRLCPPLSLADVRAYAADQLAQLPPDLQDLVDGRTVEIVISVPLRQLAQHVDEQLDNRNK